MNNMSLQDKLADNLLKDRKSERRWRNVRFFGWMFILIIYAFFLFNPFSIDEQKKDAKKPYVALIRLNGIIMPNTHFSSYRVIPELNRAFRDHAAKGVILLINSPGGSPVQASIIHDKIIELKKRFHKKVVVVGEDALASGSYLVATAADKIYVNRDTLTGSIGVIMSGFGFTDAISKLGITRRVFTAGDHKDRLDPFKNLTPEDVTKVNKVLNEVHQNFIDDVITGRGNRLKGDRKEIFSGDFWTGQHAVQLGLADGTQNLWQAMKKEFNVTHYRDYTHKTSLIQALLKNVSSELKLNLLENTSPLKAQAY